MYTVQLKYSKAELQQQGDTTNTGSFFHVKKISWRPIEVISLVHLPCLWTSGFP